VVDGVGAVGHGWTANEADPSFPTRDRRPLFGLAADEQDIADLFLELYLLVDDGPRVYVVHLEVPTFVSVLALQPHEQQLFVALRRVSWLKARNGHFSVGLGEDAVVEGHATSFDGVALVRIESRLNLKGIGPEALPFNQVPQPDQAVHVQSEELTFLRQVETG